MKREPPQPPFQLFLPRQVQVVSASSGARSKQHPRADLTCQVLNQHGIRPLKWDRTGVVMESGAHDDYIVKVDGSGRLSKRTRTHLRPVQILDDTRPPLMPEPAVIRTPSTQPDNPAPPAPPMPPPAGTPRRRIEAPGTPPPPAQPEVPTAEAAPPDATAPTADTSAPPGPPPTPPAPAATQPADAPAAPQPALRRSTRVRAAPRRLIQNCALH